MGGNRQGVWTEEEDALLAHWQSQYGNRWSDVSKHIPNKTGQQCAQRWRHRVNPAIRRTKWTQEEDELLFKLYQEHGNSWAVIARYLPGRTDQQCLGRWRRHLDPSVRRESWTISEDKKLLLLAEEFDCSWSQISKSMRNRTPQQCRTRWFHLTNHSESKASDLFAKEGSNVDEYECDLEVQIVCRGKRSHRSKKRGRLRSSIAFLSEEENPNDVQDAQYKDVNSDSNGIENIKRRRYSSSSAIYPSIKKSLIQECALDNSPKENKQDIACVDSTGNKTKQRFMEGENAHIPDVQHASSQGAMYQPMESSENSSGGDNFVRSLLQGIENSRECLRSDSKEREEAPKVCMKSMEVNSSRQQFDSYQARYKSNAGKDIDVRLYGGSHVTYSFEIFETPRKRGKRQVNDELDKSVPLLSPAFKETCGQTVLTSPQLYHNLNVWQVDMHDDPGNRICSGHGDIQPKELAKDSSHTTKQLTGSIASPSFNLNPNGIASSAICHLDNSKQCLSNRLRISEKITEESLTPLKVLQFDAFTPPRKTGTDDSNPPAPPTASLASPDAILALLNSPKAETAENRTFANACFSGGRFYKTIGGTGFEVKEEVSPGSPKGSLTVSPPRNGLITPEWARAAAAQSHAAEQRHARRMSLSLMTVRRQLDVDAVADDNGDLNHKDVTADLSIQDSDVLFTTENTSKMNSEENHQSLPSKKTKHISQSMYENVSETGNQEATIPGDEVGTSGRTSGISFSLDGRSTIETNPTQNLPPPISLSPQCYDDNAANCSHNRETCGLSNDIFFRQAWTSRSPCADANIEMSGLQENIRTIIGSWNQKDQSDNARSLQNVEWKSCLNKVTPKTGNFRVMMEDERVLTHWSDVSNSVRSVATTIIPESTAKCKVDGAWVGTLTAGDKSPSCTQNNCTQSPYYYGFNQCANVVAGVDQGTHLSCEKIRDASKQPDSNTSLFEANVSASIKDKKTQSTPLTASDVRSRLSSLLGYD